ncbi:single-stranded DNA-binding protein [Tenacibaculum maritimum]|uniref:Single-stranded DNA-binding protein n=1 Tax=Tenacibaculum maritimum NCIMB 2154 TaxID=1349785 RepID=A0A2H1E5X2_9FLAO|nr:single-stranded DNA-binding protein [Tenacibaculum maritimum]MCD9563457.1 single-stranded DNA-binding protein [Tenacibaculum maritimum]MCD9566688.1 single-stranded DNA-binding protein [Tenacibaculum maritimum]MCD9579974.1 single-stranded DNA-binding protein [Tenacibaculum maritimum]MCD9585445.1 single-stranded DNA-binding protein [Tenacibaculum maritimum]MCD9597435.1 single-stranded DNA-binding protein [Tenacibaculum maritimum]
MAGTVNKVILIGHLGDEVKMRYFEGGNAVGRFSLATNESYTNRQTGEKVVSTEWHNLVVRNKLAEICEKYLTKGDKIYCEGRIKTRQWEQDGIKRYLTEIHVVDMSFLSTKKDLTAVKNQAKRTPLEKDIPKPPKENQDLPF